MLQDYNALAPTLPRTLDITYQESIQLQLLIEFQMKPNWDWLMTVMDSTEAQLRFGSALSNLATESGQFPAGLYPGGQRGGGGRSERSLPSRSGSTGDQGRRNQCKFELKLKHACKT
jgi:E3 ubiquitin-protein ligase EDD1